VNKEENKYYLIGLINTYYKHIRFNRSLISPQHRQKTEEDIAKLNEMLESDAKKREEYSNTPEGIRLQELGIDVKGLIEYEGEIEEYVEKYLDKPTSD